MDTIHTFDPLLVKLDSFEGPLDLLLQIQTSSFYGNQTGKLLCR